MKHSESKKKRPHFVFFVPDQYRGDALGYVGNKAARTPQLDSMIETDSVAFRNAYCQNPVCTPSRCSFTTGWYPHTHGHRTMRHLLGSGEKTMFHYLKEAGWHVWWGGKNDLTLDLDGACDVRHIANSNHPDLHADEWWRSCFEDYSMYAGCLERSPDELVYRDPDWCHVLEAVRLIQEVPSDKPLCLYLPLVYPHPPYGVEEPYYSSIDRSQLPNRVKLSELSGKPSMQSMICERQGLAEISEDQWKELRATYYGMCARIDAQLAYLSDALKQVGIYDDTALFFFSDHGDYTGDYGLVEKAQNLFEDCLTNVPLVIKPPKNIEVQPGLRDALVELVDVPATVYEMAGIAPEYSHFGRALTPLLNGDITHRDAVFCQGGRLAHEAHCIENQALDPKSLYWPRASVQAESAVAHGKAIMCRTKDYKYVYRLYEDDEFYDLIEDPGERVNVIHNQKYAAQIQKLKDRVMTFLIETGDTVPWERDPRDVVMGGV